MENTQGDSGVAYGWMDVEWHLNPSSVSESAVWWTMPSTSELLVWVSHIRHVSLALHFLYALSIMCWVLVSPHIHHNCTLMWLEFPQGNLCPCQAKQIHIWAKRVAKNNHLLKTQLTKFILPRPQLRKRQSLLPPNSWYAQPQLNYCHRFSQTQFSFIYIFLCSTRWYWSAKKPFIRTSNCRFNLCIQPIGCGQLCEQS